MKYIDINPSNFEEQILVFDSALKSGTSIYAMIHATWCGACKMVSPIWNELREKDLNATVAYIDADVLKQLGHVIKEGDIKHFPTFMRIQGKRRFLFENPRNADVNVFMKWIKTNKKTMKNNKTIKNKRVKKSRRVSKRG